MRKGEFFTMEWGTVAAVFLILVLLFVFPRMAGVADNGDYSRVMMMTGLTTPEDHQYFRYAEFSFPTVSGRPDYHYYTTQVAVVWLARWLAMPFGGAFHLLWLAAVYAAVFLSGIFLTVRYLKKENRLWNLLMTTGIIFIAADSASTVYFNSLYGEGCAYAFFWLMTGTLLRLRKRRDYPSCFAFFLSAFFFFGAKLQYTLLAPLLLIVAFFLPKERKLRLAAVGMTVVMTVLLGRAYLISPPQLGRDTLHHSVFYGILKNSDDVEADLRALGLPESMAYLTGTTAYDLLITEEEQEIFYSTVSRLDVIRFYLQRPGRLIGMLELTAEQTFDNMRGMMGNYSIADAREPHENVTFFTGYNSLRRTVFPHTVWGVILLLLISFAVWVKEALCGDRIGGAYLCMLTFLAAVQFVLPTVGNGEADIAKQLFVFNITADLLVWCTLFRIGQEISLRFRRKKLQ